MKLKSLGHERLKSILTKPTVATISSHYSRMPLTGNRDPRDHEILPADHEKSELDDLYQLITRQYEAIKDTATHYTAPEKDPARLLEPPTYTAQLTPDY